MSTYDPYDCDTADRLHDAAAEIASRAKFASAAEAEKLQKHAAKLLKAAASIRVEHEATVDEDAHAASSGDCLTVHRYAVETADALLGMEAAR